MPQTFLLSSIFRLPCLLPSLSSLILPYSPLSSLIPSYPIILLFRLPHPLPSFSPLSSTILSYPLILLLRLPSLSLLSSLIPPYPSSSSLILSSSLFRLPHLLPSFNSCHCCLSSAQISCWTQVVGFIFQISINFQQQKKSLSFVFQLRINFFLKKLLKA